MYDPDAYRALAVAVFRQAVKDLRFRNLRTDARLFLTRPSEGRTFWAEVAGLDEDAIGARGRNR